MGAEGYEWDEEKRQRNIADHGVDFRLAALIFNGPVLEAEDERDDYGEVRYRALGQVGGTYYLVAYTRRAGCRRLISAWKVGERGRRRYQALLAGRDRGQDRG